MLNLSTRKAMMTLSVAFFFLINTYSDVSRAEINAVKQSSSGICHDEKSRWYKNLKKFKAYASIQACIEQGGRLYKGYKPTSTGEQNTGYDRRAFPHWLDEDGDCQDTRAEVLISQSVSEVTFSDDTSCYVTSGTWYDPYTGDTFYDDDMLDIDHVVPLKWAYEHGAHDWPEELKAKFANDPLNTIAVSLSANRSKGAKGPTEWMPPNNAYRCDYLRKFESVLKAYGLAFSPKQKRVVNRQFSACGYSNAASNF